MLVKIKEVFIMTDPPPCPSLVGRGVERIDYWKAIRVISLM